MCGIVVGICCCVTVIYMFDVETGKALVTISCVCYSVLHMWYYCGYYLLLCCAVSVTACLMCCNIVGICCCVVQSLLQRASRVV